MDIGLLHRMCKEDTRNAFDEFKRVLSFEYVNCLPNVCQLWEYINESSYRINTYIYVRAKYSIY